MSEIENLMQKKKEIEKEIRTKKIEEKEKRKNNSKSNVNELIRVCKNFNKYLEEIIKERLGVWKGERSISKPRVTRIMIKHKHWGEIINDCINFDIKEEQE